MNQLAYKRKSIITESVKQCNMYHTLKTAGPLCAVEAAVWKSSQ
jgi:hypothetical protein